MSIEKDRLFTVFSSVFARLGSNGITAVLRLLSPFATQTFISAPQTSLIINPCLALKLFCNRIVDNDSHLVNEAELVTV
jgi:hypothetical protein